MRHKSSLDRRRFLARAGAYSLALITPWGGVPDTPERGSSRENASDASAGGEATRKRIDHPLPPRVVGLRSLGGAFRFDPEGLLIEAGTDVQWLNMGDFHTVTAFHPANAGLLPLKIPLRIPEGAEPFHSGVLGLTAGAQFTHSFDVEGVYDYFCQPHYSFGMVGRVVVGGPRGGPALTSPLSDLLEVARDRLPSVDVIMGPAGRAFEWAARVNGTLFEAANGRDAAPAAGAVVEGILADRVVEEHLGPVAWSGIRSALDALAAEANRAGDYEALLRSADGVKAHLRVAHTHG